MPRFPDILIDKAPYGTPCNGCGQCCLEVVCPLGAHLFQQREGPCPALQPAGRGTWECGLITSPEAFSLVNTLEYGKDMMAGAAAFLLGSGRGCDAFDSSIEAVNEEFNAAMQTLSIAEMIAGSAAQFMWGWE